LGARRLAGLAAAALFATAGPAAAGGKLTVDGTAFVLTVDDGRVLRGADLIGAVLSVTLDGAPAELRLDAAFPDPRNPAVLLHRMTVWPQGAAEFSEFCNPDPEGKRLGFPVEHPDGSWELTCSSGAIGKCVRFGYMPWTTGPGGEPMAA
jgi:hypothetical protein